VTTGDTPAAADSVPGPAPASMKNRLIRWGLIALAGLLALLFLVVLILYFRGRSTVHATADVTAPLTNVPTDSVSIARGERLALSRGCMECHGERLEGSVMGDVAPAFIAAPNLTRGLGGVGSRYSAVDWDRAVRYGVRPDGSVLLPMMPYEFYNRLNDADMAALAAFLASRPAVDNEVPPTRLKTFGYVMFGMAGLPRDNLDRPRSIINPGPTPEYGAYVASTTCAACHGPRIEGQGGHEPAPAIHQYGEVEPAILARALREGLAADGREMDPERMPWRAFQHLDDTEVAALHAYLRTLARRD
jgi:mono/diheme cytochrome c family protein